MEEEEEEEEAKYGFHSTSDGYRSRAEPQGLFYRCIGAYHISYSPTSPRYSALNTFHLVIVTLKFLLKEA